MMTLCPIVSFHAMLDPYAGVDQSLEWLHLAFPNEPWTKLDEIFAAIWPLLEENRDEAERERYGQTFREYNRSQRDLRDQDGGEND